MAMQATERTEEFIESSPLLGDAERLRERARAEGYLFFRDLLPKDALLNLRRQMLEVCGKAGWLDDSAPLEDGIARPGFRIIESLKDEWLKVYLELQKIRDFHALALHENLIDVFRKVFGEPVLPHSRNICRVIFPQSQTYTTPPHQDHIHIGGTDETWTTWTPVGDCPSELGGLALVPRSHTQGLLPSHEAYGAGGRGVEVPPEAIWHTGELECGDVLIFHSLNVHQGRDNNTEDRLRLSLDFRYQPASHPIRSDSMLPHNLWNWQVTWDEIYAEWEATDPVKYYWKDSKLNLVPGREDK